MPRTEILACLLALVGALPSSAAPRSPEPVSLTSLLAELASRRSLSEAPDFPFRALLASSRHPDSAVRGGPGWFAEPDRGHFAAGEGSERGEQVLLEHEGPGALVRLWCDVPRGELRIYLDGATEPTLSGSLAGWMRGAGGVGGALAEVGGGSGVLILPVPFERSCRVTCSGAGELTYQLSYRAYEEGTPVTSLQPGDLERHADQLRAAASAIGRLPEQIEGEVMHPFGHRISSTGSDGAAVYAGLSNAAGGTPSAVSELRLVVEDADLEDGKGLLALLGEAVLILTFEGVDTVKVPLVDFFALRGGVESFDSRYLSVRSGDDSALLVARYLMPFRETFFVRVESLCVEPLDVKGFVTFAPYEWTANTLYFHAWSRFDPIPEVEAPTDWSAFVLEGRGQLVGDLFSLRPAPVPDGEPELGWQAGDGKLYVDGEALPSAFGTGIADHYGTRAEGGPFSTVLHGRNAAGASRSGPGSESDAGSQTGAGPGVWSHYRFRSLDLVPFLARLELDRELLVDGARDLAATALYYAALDPR